MDINNKIHQFNSDEEIIFFLNSLSLVEIKAYSKYKMKDLKDYMSYQRVWIEVEKYFLAQRLGREPSETEVIDDFDQTHNPERYRAFYALKYPDRVCLEENNGEASSSLAPL